MWWKITRAVLFNAMSTACFIPLFIQLSSPFPAPLWMSLCTFAGVWCGAALSKTNLRPSEASIPSTSIETRVLRTGYVWVTSAAVASVNWDAFVVMLKCGIIWMCVFSAIRDASVVYLRLTPPAAT